MAERVNLTTGRIHSFTCPGGKQQAFLRDSEVPSLAVRVTAAGVKSYVFESKLDRATIRIVLGAVKGSLTIKEARAAATEMKALVDRGIDPREVERQRVAAKQAAKAEAKRKALTVGEVWPLYLLHGKPRRKDAWKPRYVADLKKMAAPGGLPKKRGKGVTRPGPLASLMPLPLAQVTQDTMRDWYSGEAKDGAVQATRAMAMFSGFLAWCGTRREFRELVDRTAARASELSDILPKTRKRTDALELEQLEPWFSGVSKLRNRTAAAYLQALVLTGARREEMAALRWDNIDFRWNKLTLADKVDSTRTIPLTPFMRKLLHGLPHIKDNPHVFASATSSTGRITDPRAAHAEVLADAGIGHLSIHGLRRSFALLGEAAGAPAGAIAQAMGHRPSGVHEGYKPRSVDALRPYLLQVERFILEQAGVEFNEDAPSQRALRRVA
jgi:integrase